MKEGKGDRIIIGCPLFLLTSFSKVDNKTGRLHGFPQPDQSVSRLVQTPRTVQWVERFLNFLIQRRF